MDTKSLEVGQDVYVISGAYMVAGKVIRVVPRNALHAVFPGTAVEVQTADNLIHFDKDGVACDGKGTYECGSWVLDSIPFAERTALCEQGRGMSK